MATSYQFESVLANHNVMDNIWSVVLHRLHSHLLRLSLQWGNGTFNRAKLLNVGVREALRDEDWSCIFLHDVDLLPENDHNIYTCHKQFPTHLSVAMDKFRYR